MDEAKLKEVLEKHRKWLREEVGGEKINVVWLDEKAARLRN